jgi:ClpP class serine protease
MNFALISALARGQWAIDPLYAVNSLGTVKQILEGNLEVVSVEKPAPKMIGVVGAGAPAKGLSNSSARQIAVIDINGPLMKGDQECGPRGMASIGNMLKQLDKDPSVMGYVFHTDSPGGTVDGTEVLGNIIKNLTKPSVAFVDGLAASAALWLISNADEVIASTELDKLGSVGVLLSFDDFQPVYEKMGVRSHTIVSDLSPDKMKMWDDIRNGEYKAYIENFLNPLAEKFQSIIRANFPGVKEEHLTGKMFHARDLIGIMVNKIGTFEDAVARVQELAQANIDPISQTNNSIQMKNLPKLVALLAISELIVEDGFSTLSVDQLETIEANLQEPGGIDATEIQSQLSASEQTINERDQRIAQLLQELDAATLTINERDQRIAQVSQELDSIKAAPAENTAIVAPQSDNNDTPAFGSPVVKEGMSASEAMDLVKQEYGF